MIKKISILFLTISMMLFSSCVAISADLFDDDCTVTVQNFSGTKVEYCRLERTNKKHKEYQINSLASGDTRTISLPEGNYNIFAKKENGNEDFIKNIDLKHYHDHCHVTIE